MHEGPSIPEQYLNKYIEKKARVTSKLAAKTPNPESDPIIDEAIFFDVLANEPRNWMGLDDTYPEEGSKGEDK